MSHAAWSQGGRCSPWGPLLGWPVTSGPRPGAGRGRRCGDRSLRCPLPAEPQPLSLPRTRSGSPPWSPHHHYCSLFSCDALETVDDGRMDSSRVLSSCGTSSFLVAPGPVASTESFPIWQDLPAPAHLLSCRGRGRGHSLPELALSGLLLGFQLVLVPGPHRLPPVPLWPHRLTNLPSQSPLATGCSWMPFPPSYLAQPCSSLKTYFGSVTLSLVKTSVTAPAPAPPGGVNQSLHTHTPCKHLLLNIHEVL